MHSHAAHRCDIADICRDGFACDGIGWMNAATEVTVFRDEVGAKNQRGTRREIYNCRIVPNADWQVVGLRPKSFADPADQATFTKVSEFHFLAAERRKILATAGRPWLV